MLAIQAPTTCPSCSSELEWVNHILHCNNSYCGAQVKKRIEHFAKTLKIKGLGPVTIEKLDLDDVSELYELSELNLFEKIGSEKLAFKLFQELVRSTAAPLNVLLPAFSIPLIGKTATEKLAKVCVTIQNIDRYSCDKAGLGPKATESILFWLEDEYPLLEQMPFSFEFIKVARVQSSKGVVCISGRLSSYKTKAEATDALVKLGFEVKSTLTKAVTILINESGIESSKTKKARDSGIQIVTNLKDFIGE